MSRRARRNPVPAAAVTGALAIVLAVLAGCSATHQDQPTAPSMSVSVSVSDGSTAAPLTGVDAVSVGRAFVAAVCPYGGRGPAYGQRLNQALVRYATAEFTRAHRWSPARITQAQQGISQRGARQTCGPITGGVVPDAPTSSVSVSLRFSVQVTTSAAGVPASSGQQTFWLTVCRQNSSWLVSAGQW
ncbi:MAG: hypothetical protein JWN95_1358 [Frankiales bacterium]|nr:hypothetical protein [Frankiales bacterium]